MLTCVLWSCSDKKEMIGQEELVVKELKIVDSGIVRLLLDTDVNFEYLLQLRGLSFNGKDYVTFYDRNAHAIYLHDLESGELYKKVQMVKEGPNAVNTFINTSYFFHTEDSIFFNGLPNGIYLINSDGDVLEKKTLGNEGGYLTLDSSKPSFDQASIFKGGKINMAIENSVRKDKINERVVLNFELDSLVSEFLPTEGIIPDYNDVKKIKREKRKMGGFAFMNKRYFSRNENYLYATHSISDTLYVFEGSVLKNKIYAGSPEVEIADYASYSTVRSIETFKNGMQAFENPNQDPHYKNTVMSPDGSLIYRVLYHGTQPKMVDGKDKPQPDLTGATLIVVDLTTDELYYYDLPVEELDLRFPLNDQVFVTNSGIHFKVKGQENEDEAQFRVFELVQ